MEIVINLLNNKKLSILKFESLSNGEKEILKKNLACLECKVQAFYRRKTKDGKQACFFAKHVSGCGQGMSSPSNVDNETKEEVNKINVIYNELILKFDEGNDSYKKRDQVSIPIETDQKNTSKSYTIDPSKNKSCKVTLKKLLKYAIYKLLDDIDIPIIFESKAYKDPHDLIIEFKDVDYSLKGKKRIFWGKINSISSNRKFLNCGEWNVNGHDFSVLLSDSISNSSKLKNIPWHEGVYCIFIGTLQFNKNDKPYIRLDNINLMASETK